MSDFYLTLPSNSNDNEFENNTIGSFIVKLDSSVKWSDYEVALVELQYPKSWMSVVKSSVGIMHTSSPNPNIFDIPEGKYHTIKEFVKDIQSYLDEYVNEDRYPRKVITISYNDITLKTTIDVYDGFTLYITQSYAMILGFEKTHFSAGKHVSTKVGDIDKGMTALFVYSSRVKKRQVGNTSASLLRVVPISGGRDDRYQTHEFKHPHYIPTDGTTTDLVPIDIYRDDGEKVVFKSGKVIATLHLRPISKIK